MAQDFRKMLEKAATKVTTWLATKPAFHLTNALFMLAGASMIFTAWRWQAAMPVALILGVLAMGFAAARHVVRKETGPAIVTASVAVLMLLFLTGIL